MLKPPVAPLKVASLTPRRALLSSARTFNARLEYYLQGVGQITVSAFRRDFENFFGNTVFVPSAEFPEENSAMGVAARDTQKRLLHHVVYVARCRKCPAKMACASL